MKATAADDDDETELRLSGTRPRGDAAAADDYDEAVHLLKRLVSAGDVAKRRFCRQNYVYNPVSGRCQASLLVPSTHSCITFSNLLIIPCLLYTSDAADE